MTQCRLIVTFCLLIFPLAASAAEPQQPAEIAPREIVHHQLLTKSQALLAKRREAYEDRTNVDDIRTHQQELKQYFTKAIGGFPDRTPLNPQVTGRAERAGFRVEKLLYESRPQHYVTGTLFLPDSNEFTAPYPAVLVVCGHSANGKAYEGYQASCALLALNGIAAFIIDPICQGERKQLLKSDGTPVIASATTGHTQVGIGAILLGWNTAQYEIWDGMRGIDYLQSRSDIDGKRIGCFGNSGGGTQTSYLMALDDRIVAAAPSCYITSFEQLLTTIGPQDAEQNIFGQLAAGMNHADYVIMRAPRPTLICAATQDFFDISGSWDAFRDAKRVYMRFGYGERVDLAENDDTHGFKKPLREAAARWMLRWLADRDVAVTEPELNLFSDEEMWSTPNGQVMLLPGSRSAFDLNLEEAQRLADVREKKWSNETPAQSRERIRKTLGLSPLNEIAAAQPEDVAETDSESGQQEQVLLTTTSGVPLAGTWVKPNGPSMGTTLYLHADGANKAVESDPDLKALVEGGQSVLAIDISGIGTTQPEGQRWYSDSFGVNAGNAVIAYLCGTSLVAQRTEEILATTRFLRAEEDNANAPISLVATDELCVPALHAAVLAPELISDVKLIRPLTSWTEVIRGKLTRNQVVNAVHGVLREYDLPELVTLLGDTITIVAPVDGQGNPIN
ncbi:alpha/beta hydrolase family protein [Rubinisphaera margarita]|uniref:alpha/beta hydrolase family protein n=1 Tax=Rubinisphaera margarita TaxID=2909586 RepID=UPI001EE80D5E|nr:acetylxylan esterase [Rubinisphaera margarita]MCG6158089.1 acetylxylan esterase [Rubinisphaera margarita]